MFSIEISSVHYKNRAARSRVYSSNIKRIHQERLNINLSLNILKYKSKYDYINNCFRGI